MITNNNHWPKTDIRYWEGRVAFQTASSRTYSVQIQQAKRRAWINLHTANKEQAAILARNLYLDIRANGWDAALAHRKGAPAEKKINVTIGEYLDAVKAKSLIHAKTIESYAAALRKIASDIHNVTDKKRSTWRARVDSLKLATLAPEAIEAWRAAFIKRGSTNPLAEKDEFVIESDSAPDNGKPYEHYRCLSDFVELIGWLRAHGVVSRTPLHTLRKEFGSQINARFGLVAAQRMLRHAQDRCGKKRVKILMRKSLFTLTAALLLFCGSAWADTFRVHYSIRGSGRDITVQAESSAEARRTVMDMFPSAVVTGVHRVAPK